MEKVKLEIAWQKSIINTQFKFLNSKKNESKRRKITGFAVKSHGAIAISLAKISSNTLKASLDQGRNRTFPWGQAGAQKQINTAFSCRFWSRELAG